MKPYENKCLIIIIIISIFYLFLHCSKKETFENIDSFIKSTNNGKWNFSSYNPYSDLHNFSDVFYIINDINNSNLELMSYDERLKYNKDKLNSMNNSNTKLLIEKILNKYNNSTNSVTIQDIKYTKFGLSINYRVLLINAFDKLNYVKNKTKLKNLINTSLIKDIKLYYINKYIENLSVTSQFDFDENIVVELKYKIYKNELKDTIFNTGVYNIDYVNYILNEIKNYLKMDIINNGTSDSVINSAEIHYKFKVIAYKLDENEKELVIDNIKKLYENLFTEILNKNNTNDILEKLNLKDNEKYIINICIWKSGLCTTKTNVKIMPNCSVPNSDNTKLNTYIIKYNTSAPSGIGTCTSKYNPNSRIQSNINTWKNHIIANINNSIGYNRNIRPCNIYDINYNINGNEYFELNMYENKLGIGTSSRFNLTDDFKCKFNIVETQETQCDSQISVPSRSSNIDNYMKDLQNIKGLNIVTQNNVKAILLAEQTLGEFTNYKRGKTKKEIIELNRLRLFGKVFKLLDEYKTIDIINSSIKTKLDNMNEDSTEETKDKLYAILYLIMEKHLREKNEEFKLNELLLTDNNTTTKKRYEIIMKNIPETDESKLLKLLYMTTNEKINYFDKKDSKINKINLELQIIEKMSNEELSLYFKEINELYKNRDVNYRLKKIINSNKNNIVRIHKKLNSLSGGNMKNIMGGSIVPNNSFSGIFRSENVGIGRTLLLNKYSDLSLKHVTSHINDLVYYKGYIYIVGNSGYFAKCNLTTSQWSTPIMKSGTVKKHKNLNSISINTTGKCVIVGDDGIIMSSDDNTTNFEYTVLPNIKNDLQEVIITDNKIYIVGDGIKITKNNTTLSNDKAYWSIIGHKNSKYFNIFQNLNNANKLYCCLNLNNKQYYLDHLPESISYPIATPPPVNLSSFIYKSLSDGSLNKTKSLHIINNSNHNVFIHHNENTIYTGILDIRETPQFKLSPANGIILNNKEKINSCFIHNTNIGLITNKSNYYDIGNPIVKNIDLSNINISNGKMVQTETPSQIRNNYKNLYYFGNSGKIFNYNVNNQHIIDFRLKEKPFTGSEIQPNLTGIDRNGNNVYVINNPKETYKIISKTFSDQNDIQIQMKGNNNSLLVDNTINENENNFKLLRFNYNLVDENDNTELYSVKESKKIPLLDMNNIQLLSDRIHIKIDRNKKNNKNEFVSVAILINDKFKIWLKPEDKNNIYEFNYRFSNLNTNDKYALVKYRNGTFIQKYVLNYSNISSTKIANILYNNENKTFDKNTKTLELDDIIGSSKYRLLIIPESDNADIIYNKIQVNKNEEIEVEKIKNKINIGIKNGNLYENHKIIINYAEIKKITELKDYESQYLLDLLIDEAFKYLNEINNTNRTIEFLLKIYRLNRKNDVQEFLSLITDQTKKEMIENSFINELNNNERIDYIKNYLKKNTKISKKTEEGKKTEDDEKKQADEKKKTDNTDIVLKDLKLKLEKMKLNKDILANQFKIEQRNRLFEKEGIVSKTDIERMDSRISDVSNLLDESKKNKSKSFIDKIIGFFTSDDEEDKSVENKIKKIEEKKMKEAENKTEKKIQELEKKNKLKLEKLEEKLKKDNLEKLNKLQEQNNIELKKQEDAKKQNELLAEKEKNELELKKNELELEEEKLKNDKNKNEMDKLFDIQKNLLKKQKSLLKIVKTSEKKIDDNSIKKNIIKKTDKNIIKKKIENDKINEEDINAEEKLIEKTILKEMDEEMQKEKTKKKEMKKEKVKKPCVSFMDCYFKNLDDNFYTSYKNDYTFIKNAELPKEKQPACKPQKKCDICYLNTNGVPESINYNTKTKNVMVDMPKNMSIMGNDNVIYNVNFSQKNIKEMDNNYFDDNYENLPDCPFDPCMSCDNNNKYKLFDNAFNDKLIEKYRVKK